VNNLLRSPYLREQRQFPWEDVKSLSNQMDQAYIDIANKVNLRTIGVYAVNNQVITGNKYYIQGSTQAQQSLRQIFVFTSTATITTNIDLTQVYQFNQGYGSYTDGTNWYGLIFGTNGGSINAQISFYIQPVTIAGRPNSQIVFIVNVNAPPLTYGSITLDWLAYF